MMHKSICKNLSSILLQIIYKSKLQRHLFVVFKSHEVMKPEIFTHIFQEVSLYDGMKNIPEWKSEHHYNLMIKKTMKYKIISTREKQCSTTEKFNKTNFYTPQTLLMQYIQ